VPSYPERSLTNRLDPAGWLPAAFFDTGSDNHAFWSILSFKTWSTIYKPHVHAQSGTVFSGPLGIHNLIFAVSQMHQNIDFTKQHESPPLDITQLIRGPRRVWSDSNARHVLDSCIAALCTDIARSRMILQVTHAERLLGWCMAIIQAAENLSGLERANQTEIGVAATSGVPKTTSLIKEMYEEIMADLQDETDVQEEISHLVERCIRDRVASARHGRIRSRMNPDSELGDLTGM
jgi:hypothetical protein